MIAIAKVLKPHGVSGQIKVIPFSKTAVSLHSGSRIFIGNNSSGYTEAKIDTLQKLKGWLILTLTSITSRDQAEAIRNGFIALPPEEIGDPPEGRYFIDALIGLKVFNMAGIDIGMVEDVAELPAHDTLVIRKGRTETMIPMVHQFIESIDLERRLIIVREIEGLIEA